MQRLLAPAPHPAAAHPLAAHHAQQAPPRLDVDISELPSHFEIEASVPGVTKKNVNLEVDAARHELYLRVTKEGRDEKDETRLGFVQVRRGSLLSGWGERGGGWVGWGAGGAEVTRVGAAAQLGESNHAPPPSPARL